MPVNDTGYVTLSPGRTPFNYDWFEQVARDTTEGWLTLEEIRNQLNLFSDDSQDTYLTALEKAVRMAIEDYLGMPFAPTQYRVFYGVSTVSGSIATLDIPEVSQGGVTIDSVSYYNNNSPSTITTISASDYYYDPTGNKVILNSVASNINPSMTSPIMVTYSLDASPLADYPVIKQAGLLLFTHLYNNRSTVGESEKQKAQIPFGVDVLLRPYKPLVM